MAPILWIDITLVAIIGWSMIVGLFRGLIRGVFGFVSLALAFVGAQQYGKILAQYIESALGESVFSIAAGYAITFVLLLALFSALTLLLKKIVTKADLGALDKTGGLIFGFLRGGLFSLLLVGLLALFPLQPFDAWRKSSLVPIFGGIIKVLAESPFAEGYQHYWKFDEDRRPQFVLWNNNAADKVIPLILPDSVEDTIVDSAGEVIGDSAGDTINKSASESVVTNSANDSTATDSTEIIDNAKIIDNAETAEEN